MTVGEWLAARTPAAPDLLRDRITRALGDRTDLDVTQVVEPLLATADELLRECLASPDAKREIALDLLAVDALVTYACEAAAESPEDLSRVARDIATRYAALGAS